MRPGFHSATFFPNALLAAMLFASLIATSFFCVCFGPAWDFGCIHPFFRSKCASFYALDPVLLLNFCRVDFFICTVCEGIVAVLVANPCWSYFLFTFVFRTVTFFSFFVITLLALRLFVILRFFSLLAALCPLLVLPSRLDNEPKHFALNRSYHPLVFFSQGPSPRSIA